MKTIPFVLALTFFGCPWLVSAQSPSDCQEMYPADSYEAEDRAFYIEECMQAYGDSDMGESSVDAQAEPEYNPEAVEAEAPEETPYYDGTVEDFVQDQQEETYEYAE